MSREPPPDGHAECQECLESFPVEELTARPVVGWMCGDCVSEGEEDEDDFDDEDY